jgi:hypothetical protein
VLALLLLACAQAPGKDSATGGYDTGTAGAEPTVDTVSLDCSDTVTCFWTVVFAGGHAAAADLYLADLTAEEDTGWSEHHWLFTDVTGSGAQTFLLALDIGENPADYAPNETTLYALPKLPYPGIGVAVMAKDDAGAVADCWMVEYDPATFAGTCP